MISEVLTYHNQVLHTSQVIRNIQRLHDPWWVGYWCRSFISLRTTTSPKDELWLVMRNFSLYYFSSWRDCRFSRSHYWRCSKTALQGQFGIFLLTRVQKPLLQLFLLFIIWAIHNVNMLILRQSLTGKLTWFFADKWTSE